MYLLNRYHPKDPCETNPCQNDGECTSNYGNAECTCVNGFTGDKCEIPPEGNAPFRYIEFEGPLKS